jgi:hypothetical protein
MNGVGSPAWLVEGKARMSSASLAESRRSLLGRRGTPFVMLVEEGKAREFHDVSRARAVPSSLGSPVLPSFLASSQHWRDDTSNPWHGVDRDWSRVLDGEQQFVFTDGPVRVGDRLLVTAAITDVAVKHGRRGGEMVLTTVMTTFERAMHVVATMRTASIEVERGASGD